MLKYFNNYKWVLVFAVLVALAAGIFAWQKDKYSVSLSLTISRVGTQNSTDYKYDSYYALKASDEFGSAVEGWFRTPEMAQIIYKQADLSIDVTTLAGLSRLFQASKISPTTVEVRFGAANENDVKKISRAIAGVAAAKADLLSAKSNQGVAFTVIGGEPVIATNYFSVWQDALLGLIVGLVFGVFVKVAVRIFCKDRGMIYDL